MQRHIGEENEAGREPGLAKAGHCGSIGAIAALADHVNARVKDFGSPSFKSAGALIDAEERS